MKTIRSISALLLLTLSFAPGQIRPPFIPQEDKAVTDQQATKIFKTLRAVSFEAEEVAFPIYAGRQRVAYGVSIGDGRLLTKASEVVPQSGLFTSNGNKESLFCQVTGVYPDQDLAILEVPGLTAPAAKWATADGLEEGAFLVAMRSDGEAQALGVLSVRERSLKAADQGFLGIQMDPREAGNGVAVVEVVPGSAAAEVGIASGDVITEVAGQKVTGFFELSTRLRRMRSGEEPEIILKRGDRVLTVTPKLKGRPVEEGDSRRLQRMDQMSGSQSRVRADFGNVLQSDMELEARDAGMPVVDLQGRIVGMVIARAGRISTLILPGDEIAEVLKTKPESFTREAPPVVRRQDDRFPDERRERMQRELEMMRRMMESLQRELEGE